MGRLLRDADGVAKASFILWRRRLLPLQHRSPVELSPVDVWVDGRVLEEGVELGSIVVHHLEETLERLDLCTFLLEELDDCLPLSLIGDGGVRR